MPKMRAIKSHPFGRGSVDVGKTYEATEREAQLLVALGWAERVTRKVRNRAMVAAEPEGTGVAPSDPGAQTETVEPQVPAGNGEYLTRDLNTGN